MKLITKLKKITKLLFIISLLTSLVNSADDQPQEGQIESEKYYFMYRYQATQNDKDHSLNKFNFKNLLMNKHELVFFDSTNSAEDVEDQTYNTHKYIFTMLYQFTDLPCMNHSYLCTHSQFIHQFKPLYPEIDYNLPDEVIERFGDESKASELCLVVPLVPVMKLSDALIICHPEEKTLLDFQTRLSNKIYAENNKQYEFVTDYINQKNEVIEGCLMTLEHDKYNLVSNDKKTVSEGYWKNVEPYAYSLDHKEHLAWEGDKDKAPEEKRCLKMFEVSNIQVDMPDYFCIQVGRSDISRLNPLNLTEARYAADMYAQKINIRLHRILYNESLSKISKMDQKALDIDSKLLFPVKIEVRRVYFMKRHALNTKLKLKEIEKKDFMSTLVEIKDKTIDEVCGNIDVCKRAIKYAIETGLLPLNGKKEIYAMNMMNPYHLHVPKTNIRFGKVKDSVGKDIMMAVSAMKNVDDYFGEQIHESSASEVPNVTAILKAYNTVKEIAAGKKYKCFSDVVEGCRGDMKNKSNYIRRKIAFMQYAGINDNFFEYLGFIKETMLKEVEN